MLVGVQQRRLQSSNTRLRTVQCKHRQLLRLQEKQVRPVYRPINGFLMVLDLHRACPYSAVMAHGEPSAKGRPRIGGGS